MEQKVTILRRRKTGCPRMKVNRTGEMEYLTFPAFDQTEEVTCLVSTDVYKRQNMHRSSPTNAAAPAANGSHTLWITFSIVPSQNTNAR